VGRRWRLSVRSTSTVVAVLVVSGALTVGSLGLLHLLRDSLRGSAEDAARLQAAGLADLVQRGVVTSPLPAPRGDGVAQLVSPAGAVLASSAPGPQRPVVGLRPAAGRSQVVEVRSIPVDDETPLREPHDDDRFPYTVVAIGVGGPARGSTILVAVSLEAAESSTGTVGAALAAGLPVLVLLVGATVWWLTGRSLRPVEAIRAQVADISAGDLHLRVPEPASSDEIARLARTMNGMLDRLERAAERQRQFVADASHELRSPVATARTLLEVGLASPNVDWPTTAADVLAETGRMERIVDDLLLLARADEGTLRIGERTVDLDEVVLEEARRLRARGRVAVDTRLVSVGRVVGDESQLGRVVRNLAENAERHAAAGVGFELVTDDGVVRLAVTDDGPGVPPEHRQAVFERFARLDEGRARQGGGAGLGLAIVRELVTAHGGSVTVADANGRGARFEVVLPTAEGP